MSHININNILKYFYFPTPPHTYTRIRVAFFLLIYKSLLGMA